MGLVSKVTCNDLTSENDNVTSIYVTATAGKNKDFNELIKKYPILAINGCSDNCVNKILKSKNVDVLKTFNLDKILKNKHLKIEDPSRLDKNGELAVEEVKKTLENEINSLL
ncbi:hypothetical protein ALNOE001_16440 [Candidatus Methanobinarius endosymbioticus]|uniref:DGC domain protein n=1 Tax=Candidatus Methanobinarius endosymbioticus TaxID=2006182 RepID=A0A366MAQ9_9EURY|nr:hypothetical protein ALNOE001_16440 [Candidatus Methanobinarius endosymbioticus]